MTEIVVHNPAREEIEAILKRTRRIAVVGLSSKPDRPSNNVGRYLIERGYEVIPVNPTEGEVLGKKSYASLEDIPGKVDLVDVFRRSDQTDPIIDEAVRIKANCIWLQEGVVNPAGARRAQAAGICLLQDICIAKELRKLQI